MSKIVKSDERIKKQKQEQEKESQVKYNKMFMLREDRKNKVIRNR